MSNSIKSSISLKKVNLYSLMLVVFSLPISLKFIAPTIGLFILSSFILILIQKPNFQMSRPNLTLVIFYGVLAIGLFWSENLKSAFFDLEVKLSLLIFPIIFSFITYSKKEFRQILKVFYIGLFVSSLLLVFTAITEYNESKSLNDFFYVNLSPNIHPSYLSSYFVIGMTFLFIDLKNDIPKSVLSKRICLIMAVFFFLFNLLLLSKIGILVSTIFVLYFAINYVARTRKIGLGVLILSAMFAVFYLSYQNSPYIKYRVKELSKGLVATEGNYSKGSTGVRFKIWDSSASLIAEKPFIGHGTGDVKDVLMARYLKEGNQSAYDKKLNAHNQFFQISIATGMIGLGIFVLSLIFLVIQGAKLKNHHVIFFIIGITFYMFPESVLENQAGTIFFGLFFAMLNQKSLHETADSDPILST